MDNIKWDTSPLHHSTGPSMDAALAEFAQARGPRGASSRNVFSDLPNPQRGSGRSAATGPFASKLLEQWCFGQAPSHDVWGGSHASRALSTWIEATSAQRASRSLQRQQPVMDFRCRAGRVCGWPGPDFSCCPWVHVAHTFLAEAGRKSHPHRDLVQRYTRGATIPEVGSWIGARG